MRWWIIEDVDILVTGDMAKGEYADYMKEVEEWNVNHGKKNENIPTEENRTDRYQIGDELEIPHPLFLCRWM